MNRNLDASGVTQYETQIETELLTAVSGAGLISALRTYDASQTDARLKHVLSNVTQTVALTEAERATVVAALGLL